MSNIKTECPPKNWCDENEALDDKDLCIYEIKRDSNSKDKANLIYEIEQDDKVYDREKFMFEQKHYDNLENRINLEAPLLEEDKGI